MKTSTSRYLNWMLGIGILCGIAKTAFAADRPLNVLIIQTDEHNFRTLGCYRELLAPEQAFMWGPGVKVDTPHIDSIARRGAICTSFYAASPVCTPSRAAFMTGRYPQNTGASTNDVPMLDGVTTFAQRLVDANYATGYSGKWHLDGPGKPQWEPERRFGFLDNRFMFNRGHWKQLELTANGPSVKGLDAKGQPSYSVEGADATSFTTDWLTDRTLEFIDAHQAEPFCYMVSIPDPHGPNTVRPPYDTMFSADDFQFPRTYEQKLSETPGFLGGVTRFSKPGMAKYFGMVKCIDDNVGRMIAGLRERGLLERTMIVFTSDHGDLCGEHHRDNKGNPYEASARVPFIIAAPGVIPAGTVLNPAMTGIDFTSTLLALLGLKESGQELEGVEGRDLSKLFMTGQVPEQFDDVAIMRRAGKASGWIAAVTDRYKLVLSPEDEPWLFDLELDPDELQNFFAKATHRAIVQRLAKNLVSYGPEHQDPYLRHPKMIAELEEALK